MEAEHFSLSWKNYHLNLSSGFHELLKSEYLVDVTLAAEGQFIKAHKTILSICSPYFQQLFQVNPCKHPVIIMHGMNYNTLYNILQFMYKGEVSVKQEDIPHFLKVAETLKVKGLTERENDNPANKPQQSGSNGVNSPEFPANVTERQMMAMKRNKPAKPKPYSKTEPPPIVQSVPYAQPPVDTTLSVETVPSEATPGEMSVVPKEEPVDIIEENDDYNSALDDQTSMDVTHMLDTQLGEPSNMKTDDNFYKSQQDPAASGAGPLLFLKSRRGHPVLIHAGHMYTLTPPTTSTAPVQLTSALPTVALALHQRRVTWYCVKRRTLACAGCLVTTATPRDATVTPTLLSYSGHNHAQLHDVIQRLQAQSCSPSPELMQPPP